MYERLHLSPKFIFTLSSDISKRKGTSRRLIVCPNYYLKANYNYTANKGVMVGLVSQISFLCGWEAPQLLEKVRYPPYVVALAAKLELQI